MKVQTYLVIKQAARHWQPPRIVACRKKKPELAEDEIAVKINLKLPDKLFEEFIPEANITVPDHLMQRPVIEVEAEDPNEE